MIAHREVHVVHLWAEAGRRSRRQLAIGNWQLAAGSWQQQHRYFDFSPGPQVVPIIIARHARQVCSTECSRAESELRLSHSFSQHLGRGTSQLDTNQLHFLHAHVWITLPFTSTHRCAKSSEWHSQPSGWHVPPERWYCEPSRHTDHQVFFLHVSLQRFTYLRW